MRTFFISWRNSIGMFMSDWKVEKRIVVTDGDEQTVKAMFANEKMDEEPTIFEVSKPMVFVIPEEKD
jgi:hypothetical protein